MTDSNNLFEQILESAPSQSTSFLVLSKIKEEGRIDEVIIGCLNALNIYPDYLPLRRLLAEAYIDKGSFNLAEKEFELIASDIKNLITALKSLGEIYIRQGKQEQALNVLNMYLAHYPNDEDVRDLVERITPEYNDNILAEDLEFEEYKEEDIVQDQSEYIFDVQESEPEASTVEIDELYDTQAMHDQVKTDMNLPEISIANLEEDEFSELATPTLAEIYYNQGQVPEAISTYERVLLKDPNDRRSMERLAEIRASFEQNLFETGKLDPEEKKKKMISVLESWLSKIEDRTSIDHT